MGRSGAILTPNELVLPFGGTYVYANFGENRSRNATERVLADGHIHTLTGANRFYNLSYAIRYSYGTDNDDDEFRSTKLIYLDFINHICAPPMAILNHALLISHSSVVFVDDCACVRDVRRWASMASNVQWCGSVIHFY